MVCFGTNLQASFKDLVSIHITETEITSFGLKMESRNTKQCLRATEEENHGKDSPRNL